MSAAGEARPVLSDHLKPWLTAEEMKTARPVLDAVERG